MRRFQITIFILLSIVVGLLLYIKNVGSDIDVQDVEGVKIIEDVEKVKITFLDIGQGDATFIEFPDGSQMLVDCAKDARVIEAIGRTMDFFDKTIDYLLITHPDLDHYGGCIDVMKRFEIKHIVYNGFKKEQSGMWQEFMKAVDEEKRISADYVEIDSEEVWDIAGIKLHFLSPDAPLETTKLDSNNSSIVFKLSFGDQDILLTGDAEEEMEEYLINTYGDQLDVEVLKVGHHGSGSSSIQEFVDMTSPDFAIISAGRNNSYGHPSLRVLRRLERAGAHTLRTDTMGDIILYIEKNKIYFEYD